MAYGLEVYNSSGTLCFSNADLFTRITYGPFQYNLSPGQTSQKFYVPGVHDTASQPNKKLVQVAVMPNPGNNVFTPPTQTQTGVDETLWQRNNNTPSRPPYNSSNIPDGNGNRNWAREIPSGSAALWACKGTKTAANNEWWVWNNPYRSYDGNPGNEGDWFTLSNPDTTQGASGANSSGWCFVLRRG